MCGSPATADECKLWADLLPPRRHDQPQPFLHNGPWNTHLSALSHADAPAAAGVVSREFWYDTGAFVTPNDWSESRYWRDVSDTLLSRYIKHLGVLNARDGNYAPCTDDNNSEGFSPRWYLHLCHRWATANVHVNHTSVRSKASRPLAFRGQTKTRNREVEEGRQNRAKTIPSILYPHIFNLDNTSP